MMRTITFLFIVSSVAFFTGFADRGEVLSFIDSIASLKKRVPSMLNAYMNAVKPLNKNHTASAVFFERESLVTCSAPSNLVITNITNSGATISWTSSGTSEYEYAVITSPTPPVSGTVLQGATTEFVSGLSPGTYYYLHVKAKCGIDFSNWVTSEPFRTNDAPSGLITWVPTGQMNFGVSPFNPTTSDNRIAVTGLTRGSGVQTATSGPGSVTAANNAWGGYGWQGAENQDIQFTVTANGGYVLSLTTLQLSYRISSTGPASATLSYAIGSGGFTAITTYNFVASSSGFTAPDVNLSGISALQNLPAGTVVRFRILPAAAGTNTGTFYIFNEGLVVKGTVSSTLAAPVPEPITVIHPTCFTASWAAVPTATNYFIDVYQDGTSTDPNSTTLAGWSFDIDGNPNANTGIAANLGKPISVVGANGPTVSSGTARATSWTDGNGTKYWELSLSSTNYYNLKLSSKQRSSSVGPRDFKIQYKIGAGGTYVDIPGGAVPPLADNYTNGVVSNLPLPSVCENQGAVFLRWIMTSNTSISNATVTGQGSSNIDDILITGNQRLATVHVPGYNNLSVGNVTAVQVTGLTPLTKYYVVLRAEASGNTSNSSAPVTVTTNDYTTTTYRSRQSGNWNSTATWEYDPGCSTNWIAATVVPTATNNVLVQSGHVVTLTTSATISSGKTVTVGSGGTLVTGTNAIGGTGNFELQSGGILTIGSPDGISASGNSGNIRVTGSRTFSPAANYHYAGTVNQLTGTGLPATITGTLTVANTGLSPNNLLTLSASTSAAILNLQSPLALNDKSLTTTTLTGNGSFTGSKAASLTVNGGTSTLFFTQTTDTVSNALGSLTINGGNITLGNKLAIYTQLNIAGGTLNLAAKPLVLKSNSTGTASVAEIKGTLTGATAVTVERYIPQLNSRKWRLLTSPVTGTSINASWQEGMTFSNGANSLTGTITPATPVPGFGTLITGHGQGTATNAAANGFDFWDGIAMAASSLRRYAGAPSSADAAWAVLPNTTTPGAFEQCQAYLLFVRGDRTVSVAGDGVKATTLRATGTLRQGEQKLTLYGSVVQSHTLVGNPFAAPLDFDKVYQDNPGLLKRYFWVVNSGYAGPYGAYQLVYGFPDGTYQALPVDFTAVEPSSATAAQGVLHSGSAILAVPEKETTTVQGLVIKESHKASLSPAVNVFRAAKEPVSSGRLLINLSEGTGTTKQLLDGVMALWQRGSGVLGEDLPKMSNVGENLSIQKKEKDCMVTSASVIHSGDTLALRLWNTAAKTYLLEFKALNLQLNGLAAFLYDHYLQTKTFLSLANGVVTPVSITLTGEAAARHPRRFSVVFETHAATLPVLVSSLRAYQVTGGAAIRWTVEDEKEVSEYTVERSADARSFTPLAHIAARGGQGPQVYETIDPGPGTTTYYRLLLKNHTNETKQSAVVKLVLQGGREGFSVSPNPVTGGILNLHLQNKPAGVYRLAIFNAAGQTVWQQALTHPGGTCVQSIGLNGKLAEGFYVLELKGSGKRTEKANFLLQ